MKAGEIVIKDVSRENLEDFSGFCVPPWRRAEPAFVKGIEARKVWALDMLASYGSFAKLAYEGSEPVGIMEYESVPEEKIVKIHCIFVPQKENTRKGVGRALLKALISDMHKPKPYFENETPLALVTQAFEVWGAYPQHKFYEKMGFKRAKVDDPFLLCYPVKKGYVYVPKEETYKPQGEDRGKALIFYKAPCPFGVYFAEMMKKAILEVVPDIPIRVINRWVEPAEVKKRGSAPDCIVNSRPIETFIYNKAGFQKEIRMALETNQ